MICGGLCSFEFLTSNLNKSLLTFKKRMINKKNKTKLLPLLLLSTSAQINMKRGENIYKLFRLLRRQDRSLRGLLRTFHAHTLNRGKQRAEKVRERGRKKKKKEAYLFIACLLNPNWEKSPSSSPSSYGKPHRTPRRHLEADVAVTGLSSPPLGCHCRHWSHHLSLLVWHTVCSSPLLLIFLPELRG